MKSPFDCQHSFVVAGTRRAASLTCVLMLASLTCAQTTWFVDAAGVAPGSGTTNDPYVNIQFAIDQVSTVAGDTVEVRPGSYAENNLSFRGKAIVVRSEQGQALTDIDAGSAGRAWIFDSGETAASVLEGFRIHSGQLLGAADSGAGILCSGTSPTIRNCSIEDCEANFGGGIALLSSSARLEGVSVTDCEAFMNPDGRGGGIYADDSSLTLADCGITGCEARRGGAMYFSSGSLNWDGGNVVSNQADPEFGEAGGGLLLKDSAVTLQGLLVASNLALGSGISGGGGEFLNCTGSLENCAFTGNAVGDFISPDFFFSEGGGLALGGCTLNATNCQFIDNLSGGGGGGILAGGGGSLMFQECLIKGCVGQFGGGIQAGAESVFVNCTITENQAFSSGTQDFGGGVYGPALLRRCKIFGNRANGEGGGADGAVLVDCDIFDNHNTEGDGLFGRGGGASGCDLSFCSVFDNVQVGSCSSYLLSRGGGLANCTAVYTEIYGNRAPLGGGVSDCQLDRCTIFGNQATNDFGPCANSEGGAVYSDYGSNIENSILWDNEAPAIAGGGSVSIEYSNVENGFVGLGNFSADPLFWFADGGDFHLRAGSPCIDAGDPAGMDLDGSPVDVGAWAFLPNFCPQTVDFFCTAKTNSQGCVSEVSTVGSPSLSSNQPFTLSTTNVINQKAGLFFYGVAGRTEFPFLGGTLCVIPPLRRPPLIFSDGNALPPEDCSGSFTFDFNDWMQNGTATFIQAGDQVDGQFWYRDPASTAGSGLTNAVGFIACP